MIFIASSTWSPTDHNPFTEDGTYGEHWSAFIYDSNITYYSNVYKGAKLHTLRVSHSFDTKHHRLFDFLHYELSYQRNVIIKSDKEMNIEALMKEFDVTPEKVEYRSSDTEYMVHSTTTTAWNMIKAIGALLSPNELKKAGILIHEIGLKPMLEPKDYSDYIMLDVLNGCGELVVNSRNLGYVCIDPNMNYEPGVRLYFDVKKMFEDNIVTRDGLHLVKIKDKLPLDKYLLANITANDFNKDVKWTPSLFTEKANQLFFNKPIHR